MAWGDTWNVMWFWIAWGCMTWHEIERHGTERSLLDRMGSDGMIWDVVKQSSCLKRIHPNQYNDPTYQIFSQSVSIFVALWTSHLSSQPADKPDLLLLLHQRKNWERRHAICNYTTRRGSSDPFPSIPLPIYSNPLPSDFCHLTLPHCFSRDI